MKSVQTILLLLLLPLSTFAQRDTLIAAGPEYSRSGLSRTIWGDHYRETWTTPVRVPVFDVKTIKGGLTPVELGGGRQTISLQFRGADGNEYVARTVNKNPEEVLPVMLRGTFAAKVVKDQVSSAHPFGALVVPKMADALDIFHPDPQLFYVPSNPGLGEFNKDFNDHLVMLEIRPDEDAKVFDHYEDVDGSDKLLENLNKSGKYQVDAKFFLRNRLFDMILGDWDRHAGQFKWGETSDGRYMAIPKDRDQAFTQFDGLIPSVASTRIAVRELEHFDENFRDIIGLNIPARHIDRRFLADLDYADWEEVIRFITSNLTDEVIDAAVRDLPAEIYELSGPEIARKLKLRRNALPEAARKYYLVLAEKISITGSDETDVFRVQRLPEGKVRVTGYNHDQQKEIFDRTFIYGETDEIRIFTLGGNDSLFVTGEVDKSMKVRLIPGTGLDYADDASSVNGLFNKTKVYTHQNSRLTTVKSGETKVIRGSTDTVFAYTDTSAQYSRWGPVLSVEYNVDDGLFLGAGVVIKREGFMKRPWGSEHKAVVNFSTLLNSYNARYEGMFYSKLGRDWDLGLFAEAFGPKFLLNYFGQGNETEEIYNPGYYRMRMEQIEIRSSIGHRVSKRFRYDFGPAFNYTRVDATDGRGVTQPTFVHSEDVDKPFNYGGGFFNTYLTTVDDLLNPSKGLRWTNNVSVMSEIEGPDLYTDLGTDFSFYYQPGWKALTMAHRVGGSHILGDFRFFQSNFLGGTTNLRGFRRERFAGRSMVFTNHEARLRLTNFNVYFLAGEMGVLGFFDAGRVWADNENSALWHYGTGPGLWLNFMNLFIVSGTYGFSENGDRMFNLNSGFLF